MKVGIKYCGGCNPRYDRSRLVNQIKQDYQDIACFEYVKQSELYDVILVICGCPSSCAEYKSYEYKNSPILINSEFDAQRVKEALDKMLQLSN